MWEGRKVVRLKGMCRGNMRDRARIVVGKSWFGGREGYWGCIELLKDTITDGIAVRLELLLLEFTGTEGGLEYGS